MIKAISTALCCFICLVVFGQDGWSELPNAPSGIGRFDDVFFINDDIGWAANGPSGIVYKTTDGGNSWIQQFSPGGFYFRNIEFLDENVGFLGSLDGIFFKTIDGGANWIPVGIVPNPDAICGLDTVGTSTIYGCGAYFSPAFIIKSVDGGDTWTFIDMSAYAEGLVEVLFIDELHGFASGNGTNGGVVLETFDGGTTWNQIFISDYPGDYVWKLQLMDNNTRIFGSVQSNIQGKLIKSSDSGATWEQWDAPEEFIQAVGFINPTHGWMGGHGTGFHRTTNGGLTWENMNLGFNLNRFIFLNENLAYCSGETIYKFGGTLSVSDFDQVTAQAPDLKITIAPMPIVDRLNIEIEYQHTDNLLLGLYTLNGQLVERLTRDRIAGAGTKTYTFEFNHPAGSYILDFHTNDGRRTHTIIKK